MDLAVFDAYISHVFQPCMVKPARALLYSAVLLGLRPYEEELRRRFRLNVLLYWRAGWYKSSLASFVGRLLPPYIRFNEVLSASSAALRGSFVDGRFYPPEFIISDIILFPELASVVRTDEDMMGVLLSAAEEGVCRSLCVKNMKATASALNKVREYGADFEDGRLVFRNRSAIWACTHTLDVIPPKHVEAFVSRFAVIQIEDYEFDYELVKRNPNEKYDLNTEDLLRNEIAAAINRCSPNLEFAYRVFSLSRLQLTPREAGDFIRCALAVHSLCPEYSAEECLREVEMVLGNTEILTPKEKIVRLIKNNPRSHEEICKLTGISRSNCYTILNRLKALKKREDGVLKYYLE